MDKFHIKTCLGWIFPFLLHFFILQKQYICVSAALAQWQKNQAMQKELRVNNNSSPLPHHRCCYRCWSCLCCCPNPKKRRSFLGVLVLQLLRRMSLAAWAQEYVGGLELLVHVRVHHSWRNHSRNWNRQVSLIASVSPGPLAMGLRWCEMLALFASSLLEDQGTQYVLG